MDKHLHIVCHDVPYPVDYGGVFDQFYKIKTLYNEGIKIHLHCFDYGRGKQEVLHKYCEEVHYYERHEGHRGLSLSIPYIVSSRANPLLLENLQKDNYPILFEGIHTTYYLHQGHFKNRKTFLRLHNVEFKYYKQLASQSKSPLKKIFFWNESRLLKKYEKAIANETVIIALSESEAEWYSKKFNAANVKFLPVFIGWEYPLCKEGMGTFCLYHGNLSVPENEKAAEWLLEKVFNDLQLPLVVAGKNPSSALEKLAHVNPNTCIVSNPSETEMQDLIQKAQINILPSFTETGIKLKLLNAVFCVRHIVVNDPMTKGTHVESACHIAANADAFKSILVQLYRRPFEDEEIHLREGLMHLYYNNIKHAQQLSAWIY